MTYQPRVASTRGTPNHLWTVEEYRQLVKARLVGVQVPSELVAGQIICHRSPFYESYRGCLHRLCAVLQRCVGVRAKVRSHHPIVFGRNSELRPDIVLLRGDAACYRYHPPTSDDIALLLEVADSGWLTVDAALKAQVYAEAGVQDYWVFDASRAQLHVFRNPVDGEYGQHQVFQVGQSVSMLLFDDVVATLQAPVPLHFLTRQSRGRRRQTHARLPLSVTRHRAAALPFNPKAQPLPSNAASSAPAVQEASSQAADATSDSIRLPVEPQSVPSPRFLQPATVAPSPADLPVESTTEPYAVASILSGSTETVHGS